MSWILRLSKSRKSLGGLSASGRERAKGAKKLRQSTWEIPGCGPGSRARSRLQARQLLQLAEMDPGIFQRLRS